MVGVTEPRLLILEASTRAGLVALARGARVLGERRLHDTRRHGRDLAPATRELLGQQGWRPGDVDGVIVGTGPGSYTGLRVAVMSAKAFAFATGCALISIPGFAALAEQAPAAETLDVFADAQQDRVYWQQFERAADRCWRPRTALAIHPFAGWLAAPNKAAWVTGPGLIGKEHRVPADMRVVERSSWEIRAESLLRLGLARYTAGERDVAWTLEPLYLRPSAAEQQWDARTGGGQP